MQLLQNGKVSPQQAGDSAHVVFYKRAGKSKNIARVLEQLKENLRYEDDDPLRQQSCHSHSAATAKCCLTCNAQCSQVRSECSKTLTLFAITISNFVHDILQGRAKGSSRGGLRDIQADTHPLARSKPHLDHLSWQS